MNAPRFDLSDPDAARFCPVCGAGYTAEAARCPACDADLVARADIQARQPIEPPDASDDGEAARSVALCRLADRAGAALLEVELEKAGIAFFTRELGLQPLSFEGFPALVEFRVTAEDLARARDVLSQVEASIEPAEAPSDPSVTEPG